MSHIGTHGNYAHTWWTPPEWKLWVRKTLGGEYFDPCPCDWEPGRPSGLEVDWGKVTYCNHPGSRGSARRWFSKYEHERKVGRVRRFAWCLFNIEQLRHLPQILALDGWLVLPRRRIGFVWGGPDRPSVRYGEIARSPAQWSAFWVTEKPAPTPIDCSVIRTGAGVYEHVGAEGAEGVV